MKRGDLAIVASFSCPIKRIGIFIDHLDASLEANKALVFIDDKIEKVDSLLVFPTFLNLKSQ